MIDPAVILLASSESAWPCGLRWLRASPRTAAEKFENRKKTDAEWRAPREADAAEI